MKSRLLLLLATLFVTSISGSAQKDMLLFRDGSEKMVKVVQVNNDRVVYKEKDSKNSSERSVRTTEVFMIKYENKTNVFFDEVGERSERKPEMKRDKKDIMVYLIMGAEIPVYSIELKKDGTAVYKSKKNDVKERILYKSEIFMVKYPDGSKDILADYVSRNEETVTPNTHQGNDNNAIKGNGGSTKDAPLNYPCKAVITKKDGTEIRAIVYSADNTIVYYRKLNNPDGPLYKLERNLVKGISALD